ncbi:glycosyltransferase family 4 protein [Clostridium sp. WILCCON 0269]|uniref:Glycosyltransferase family 4 protein n=1 Tax=Candidatus Clostridium eludens TaxID=3381663 RepID=A0ABW8SEZ7_9CLOT
MTHIRVLQVISANDTGGGGVHVLNLAFYSQNVFHCTIGTIGEGELYEKSKSLKIDTVKFKKNPTYGKDIMEYIMQNQIDIVNFHGAKAFFIYYLLRNKITVPAVATVHSNYKKDFLNNKIKYLFYTPLSSISLKKFKYYICVSNYLKNLLEKNNFKGEKFIVTNGIDFHNINIKCNRENIRKKYGILKDDFVYVNVARMHPIKNQISLIKAFNLLRSYVQNVKLLIVGDGPMEKELRKKILQLNLEDNVILAGYKPNAIDFINAGEVGILTSFNEGGAPPIVLLESAAVKKFFIAPDVGSIGKVMDKGSVLLVNPVSEEDIYRKMKEVYDKRDEISLMGQNLYNASVSKFSIDNFCRKYLEAYTEVLSEK